MSVLNTVNAEILFEEDFDSQTDWFPTGVRCGITQGTDICPDSDVPLNWTYYRNENDDWRPDNGYPENQYGQRITSDIKRGVSGKSWVKVSESNQPPEQANYYSDSILMKKLDTEYNELYVSFWIKMQPNWQWQGGGRQLKLFRVGNLDDIPSGDVFDIGSKGNTAPLYIFDFYNHETWGWQNKHAPRCDPQLEEYLDCGTAQYRSPWTIGQLFDCQPGQVCTGFTPSRDRITRPTFQESVGDGQWHNLKFRVKLNSAPGVEDGLYEFWLDGNLEISVTGIPYREINSPAGVGWNFISIGGNWNNWFAPVEDRKELWYAIDDIIVSTTDIDKKSPAKSPGFSDVRVIKGY